MKMWAGLISGDPRIVRATRKEALDAAREWQSQHREYKGSINAVSVDVQL